MSVTMIKVVELILTNLQTNFYKKLLEQMIMIKVGSYLSSSTVSANIV